MTNSKTTQCGIYELPMKLAAFDTGYDIDTINKLIEDFEQLGKVKYDRSTDEIAIHNWRKYNETSSPKVLACIRKEITKVKSKLLLDFMGYENDRDYTPANRSYRVSDKTREFIFNRDNYKCKKCGSPDDPTIDHIYPRTLGGLSDLDNLRTLCRSCNSKRPLIGEALKQEILESGYDYDKLKLAYQYPIGSHPQKEQEEEKEYKKEKEEEQKQGEEEGDLQTLWIRTFGRNPKLPELELTEQLVEKFGYKKVLEIYKKAVLLGFNKIQTLVDSLDGKGEILPKNFKSEPPKDTRRFGNSAIMNELYPEG